MAQGALVCGVSFLKSPGRKNDAGETDVPALIPPQPATKNGSGSNRIANHNSFQFNLTCIV